MDHINSSNFSRDDDDETDDQPTAWFFSQFWATCFSISLVSIILLGVIGNALVIYVSLRTSSQRGPTTTIDVFILHLSCADFLFLIFCVPFQGTVYISNYWPYGLFMCKSAHYCQSVTMYASIWILTLMSIDRYVAIGHPLKSVKWRTIERATRSSIAVWTLALLLSSPYLFLYTTIDLPTGSVCYDNWSAHTDYRKWSVLFVFVISYLSPTLLIFFMALLVYRAIRTSVNEPFLRSNSVFEGGNSANNGNGSTWFENSKTTNRRRRKRVVWLVFALAAFYLFCWSSHSVLLVWLSFDQKAWEWVEDNSWTFFVLKIVGHMLTYAHSSLNPILYSLAYEQFRHRLLNVFGQQRISKSSLTSLGTGGGGGGTDYYCYGGAIPSSMVTLSRQSTRERLRRTQCSRV